MLSRPRPRDQTRCFIICSAAACRWRLHPTEPARPTQPADPPRGERHSDSTDGEIEDVRVLSNWPRVGPGDERLEKIFEQVLAKVEEKTAWLTVHAAANGQRELELRLAELIIDPNRATFGEE